MSEWKSFCLGDVCKFIDYRGKTPPKVKSGVPLVTAKIIKNGLIQEPKEFIAEEFYSEWMRRGIPKKGDVIFTTEAPLGEVAQIKTDRKLAFAQRVIILESDDDILCSSYLFYALQDIKLKSRIEARQSGTTVSGIKASELRKVEIDLPPLETQKKIAAVLSALDDKIELNNAINRNLEEQAQAIFDNFFVEDNRFVEMDSELLSDLCEVITKGTTPTTLGKKFVAKGINFIKAESIQDNHSIDFGKVSYIDKETQRILKRSVIKDEDILFTIAGTLGRFTFVDKNTLPANTNQAVAIIRTDKRKINPRYVYSFFLCNWHINHYKKLVQQSVQANLSLTTIKSLSIPILSNGQMKNYNELIEPIIFMIKSNQHENRRLSELRDALLPRLMSGEIDVSNVEI